MSSDLLQSSTAAVCGTADGASEACFFIMSLQTTLPMLTFSKEG